MLKNVQKYMKKILTIMLLIHSGLVSFAQQGSPCLAKKTDRTKEELITELFKTENKALLKEYKINVNQMLINLGDAPLKGDEDLKSVVRWSEIFTKADLESIQVYSISNGFKKSNGSIAYIPNDPLKENYTYLVYKNIVYAALNCGNPIYIFAEKRNIITSPKQKNEPESKFEPAKVDTVKPVNNYYVINNYYGSSRNERVLSAQDAIVTYQSYQPAPVYYQQQPMYVQQPSFGWGGYVNVSFNNQQPQIQQQAPPQYCSPYRPVRPSTPPPRYTPQSGGPVTPSHGGGFGPVTPNHGGTSGGPVTPNHRQ